MAVSPDTGQDVHAIAPTGPDWRGLIRGCREALDLARLHLVDRTFAPPARLSAFMPAIVMRLTSRHVPADAEDGVPEVPWSAVRRWRALFERRRYRPDGILDVYPEAVARSLLLNHGAALDDGLRKLENWLMRSDQVTPRPSGAPAGPILRDARVRRVPPSGWTELTIRVPIEAVADVDMLARKAVDGRPTPAPHMILERIDRLGPDLAALPITHLFVYGSVAAGTARPWSDVDCIAVVDEAALRSDLWVVWDDTNALLERAFKCRVDLHVEYSLAAAEHRLAGKSALLVWEADRG